MRKWWEKLEGWFWRRRLAGRRAFMMLSWRLHLRPMVLSSFERIYYQGYPVTRPDEIVSVELAEPLQERFMEIRKLGDQMMRGHNEHN